MTKTTTMTKTTMVAAGDCWAAALRTSTEDGRPMTGRRQRMMMRYREEKVDPREELEAEIEAMMRRNVRLANLGKQELWELPTEDAGEAAAENENTPCSPDDLFADDDDDDDDDGWYDDPADRDDLPSGYYSSRSGDFYVDDCGQRCDVVDYSDYGGMRMYYDEDNGGWREC